MSFDYRYWIVFSTLILVLCSMLLAETDDDINLIQGETRLMRTLLNEKTYLKKVRPSHQVIVDIRFVYNQIVSMVEKEQIIVSNCFVDQKWTGKSFLGRKVFNNRLCFSLDPRLVWNPADFYNITWIRMPATSVW